MIDIHQTNQAYHWGCQGLPEISGLNKVSTTGALKGYLAFGVFMLALGFVLGWRLGVSDYKEQVIKEILTSPELRADSD